MRGAPATSPTHPSPFCLRREINPDASFLTLGRYREGAQGCERHQSLEQHFEKVVPMEG
jgi:hypothetical protein